MFRMAATLALLATATADSAAVFTLIDRVLPGASSHFVLAIVNDTATKNCFSVSDSPDGKVAVVASDASLLAAGVGYYLREHCNMTIGWVRGGGDGNVRVPASWPAVGKQETRCRHVDHLYFMNVCTHSYSLVWYGWAEWERLLDWMALSGFNNYLAMTGQEEVAYRAFTSLGVAGNIPIQLKTIRCRLHVQVEARETCKPPPSPSRRSQGAPRSSTAARRD